MILGTRAFLCMTDTHLRVHVCVFVSPRSSYLHAREKEARARAGLLHPGEDDPEPAIRRGRASLARREEEEEEEEEMMVVILRRLVTCASSYTHKGESEGEMM